jgi:Pyruvate/2-oxoacid:ferredoxin oxidoreductase delta subunit
MKTDNIYIELAHKLNQPNSKILPKILKKLVTPADAKLLLMLPAEPAALAKQTSFDESAIKQKLQEFLERGLVFPTSKGPQLARDYTQLHDATLSSLDKWIDDELLDLWKEFHEVEWIPSTAAGPGESFVNRIKVLPALKSIKKSSSISPKDFLPIEDVRALIKDADAIAVVPCSCRRSMRRCNSPVNVCLQFNKSAKYHLDRGTGRKLTPDEAIAIAMQAEEKGLIHTWPIRASQQLNEICNCCRECCVIFDGGLRYNNVEKTLEKSRFHAIVDNDLCTGCEECVERCFFVAITLSKAAKSKDTKAVIDTEKCFGCGLCVVACDFDALSMVLPK